MQRKKRFKGGAFFGKPAVAVLGTIRGATYTLTVQYENVKKPFVRHFSGDDGDFYYELPPIGPIVSISVTTTADDAKSSPRVFVLDGMVPGASEEL